MNAFVGDPRHAIFYAFKYFANLLLLETGKELLKSFSPNNLYWIVFHQRHNLWERACKPECFNVLDSLEDADQL